MAGNDMTGNVSEQVVVERRPGLPEDLWARIVSGVILAIVALGANWIGGQPFVVLVALVALLMSWEWSRILGRTATYPVLLQMLSTALSVAAAAAGEFKLAAGLAAAGCALVAVVGPGQSRGLAALGVLYVALPAVAMIWLRQDTAAGGQAILYLFVIVWATDTFAYVCGRLIGGPKLWPRVSPGKTWAGSIGGLVFAAIGGALFGLVAGRNPVALAMIGALLSAFAQAGDLAESMLKRAFSVKHASDLIPGHGGFMDRMDGIVAAVVVAALIAALRKPETPALALLSWP